LEKLGINQSRSFGVASLNEFRAAFGLPVHKSFDSITSDPGQSKKLMHFYSHPDNVEFYPGILVEESKSKFLKAGWIPGPTTSRAILCDTVSLLRGDRFYTQVFPLVLIVDL
jgi:linoleate 8R-lipoxygenase / 9,12-octadecadienoate 8-hydroperoxide 8R-isomerase